MISALYSLDVEIYHLINLFYHNAILNNLALMVSYLGVVYVGLIIAILIILFDKKRGKQIGLILIAALLLTFALTAILKLLILRPRPYTILKPVVLLAAESDYSFPSGHTATATCISYILGKEYGKLKYFMLIPIIVALSRIYIGVHYPSDVIGGFLIGFLISYSIEYIFHNKSKMKCF